MFGKTQNLFSEKRCKLSKKNFQFSKGTKMNQIKRSVFDDS